MKNWLILLALLSVSTLSAQDNWEKKFEQLGTLLPTPNDYRNASGAPGKDYWQQRADYDISIEINDENQTVTGSETITYYNQSPDDLKYLWIQLDQNIRSKNSTSRSLSSSNWDRDSYSGIRMAKKLNGKKLATITGDRVYNGGFNIQLVQDGSGNDLDYVINNTMMRVELPQTLNSGEKYTFSIKWNYLVNDRLKDGGRSGYEYFPEDDNYLYTIAQFYPRMAAYLDNEGWQNKQFIGSGEFTLSFGDFNVEITVPEDFVVASTGTLQNPEDVLTKDQLDRLEKSKTTYDKPVMIINEKEAIKNEKKKEKGLKTWVYKADNVRDFAFACSRKFLWDAMAVDIGDNKKPLAMSYYPKEGNPLWEQYSTKAVAQTLKTYSKHTIAYPYPVAISVHTASIGMEYPMICFNYGRPNPDGSYSDRLKYGMISVIIHEVGHNFFPMIINSDERQWTWMDEGLNTFVQYLTEKEWDPDYPSRRGPAENIVPYMKGDKNGIRPIMTNSEQILQFGNNAYGKPATALNLLREVVMGPELFDYAFKEYAQRWAFKHPAPADFFRTMEDASAVDLDWFWKGWFYTVDHVDIGIDNVKWYRMDTDDDNFENKVVTSEESITGKEDENKKASNFEEAAETFFVKDTPENSYSEFMNRYDDEAIKKENANKHFYEVTFVNEGGLVSPLIIEWTYKDGTKALEKIPAEIWRMDEYKVSKIFTKDKEVVNIALDPKKKTADVNLDNNNFPKVDTPSKFDEFKEGK
ncbi:MAG TPA: M1 family metallopeptidase [Cyclobacteriaceae bacterium]